MVFGRTLPIHLGVIIEEVGVDLVQEPWFLESVGLHEHKERGRDPIDESTCWPLMSERQMHELEYLEKRAETIHKPMLVLFGNASLEKVLDRT